MHGMPGSTAQASLGGDSPRTQKISTNPKPSHFEVQAKGEQQQGGLEQDEEHARGGQALEEQHPGRQEEGAVWVKGAPSAENERYKSFLEYMEEKREEARARLHEDKERIEQAKRLTESWALMREAVRFLKKNSDSWRERRIDECERIREEEKLDRLALVKVK